MSTEFQARHQPQLQALHIPHSLVIPLEEQLLTLYGSNNDNNNNDNHNNNNDEDRPPTSDALAQRLQVSREMILASCKKNPSELEYGALLVLPHLCSWEIRNDAGGRGLYHALIAEEISTDVLSTVLQALNQLSCNSTAVNREDGVAANDPILQPKTREDFVHAIYTHESVWSVVVLYQTTIASENQTRAALLAPPYFPHVERSSERDTIEADLVGPFPFQYHLSSNPTTSNSGAASGTMIDLSLAYMSPEFAPNSIGQLPTIDLVPSYSCPSNATRTVRYAALLGTRAPAYCQQFVKERFANFVHEMHLVRQKKEELSKVLSSPIGEMNGSLQEMVSEERYPNSMTWCDKIRNSKKTVWKVYTDTNDPMALHHPEAGLTAPHFQMTTSPEEADIIYSFQSLFAPGPLRDLIQKRCNDRDGTIAGCGVLINQFPYEGAFVQKDHLAREILNQHGLPRPSWALETYDLDVHLAEFVGSVLMSTEWDGEEDTSPSISNRNQTKQQKQLPPLWIVKPARGTQSKGHFITRSTANVLKVLDAEGSSRVVQRYIENPVCVENRKVDCRCIVMMTTSDDKNHPNRPGLYMHERVYFRIANKEHSISTAADLVDSESFLTATHLLNETDRTSTNPLLTLPTASKTIAILEQTYGHLGFDWKEKILPKIHTMIRELFSGMMQAFPAMACSVQSRALYGVDVMFETDESTCTISPKLTEVTFCPANNAICDAYERDDELYRNYNNDVFNCLFLGILGDSVVKLR